MTRPHADVRRHPDARPRTPRSTPRGRATTTVAVVALVAGLALAAPPTAGAEPVENPDVVRVGSGSYASAPPAALDNPNRDVSGFVDKDLYLDESLAGTPVPTNAWWTDLLVSRYSGDLWANPLVVSNAREGTRVTLPTRWNDAGTARVLESPIVVGATAEPALGPSDVVMADFEDGYPTGWAATGTAFSGGPAAGTAAGQSPVSGFLGNRLVNSFTAAQGDGATGTLTSPTFTVDRDHVAFLVGGGNHPGQEEVRLVVDGQTVRAATGKDSEQLAWVTWDVADLRGRTARIEVVDQLQAGWAHVLVDQVVRTDDPDGLETRLSSTFAAQDATVTGWGEWDVSWRLRGEGETADRPQGIDVTAARGVPYVWFELDGVQPRITVDEDAELFGLDGAPLTLPADVSALRVQQDGRSYGIHLPDGSHVERAGNALLVTASAPYLVVSAVSQGAGSGADLAAMHQRAFAVVRDTRMEYDYDVASGLVTQTWDADTEALQGANLDTLQGWLPHHYREADQDLAFTGGTYDTPRGLLRTTAGHGGWELRYPFEGIVPFLPDPEGTPGYDRERMVRYVEDYAAKTGYGGDTYWGGKDVLQLAEYMAVAKEIGADDAYSTLKGSLTTALDDWFTYTPGETEHFFARYPTWQALIGFSDSYGSLEFTDNHFHYGYFTLAAAYLALEDPEWGAQYGDLATLVAKQYGNWDREDDAFPYLRTFDTWQGHSYAGGLSSPGGNNQESSSEAIQSWVGLFLLGSALGDDAMRDTGAMGYVTERAAVQEYWFDYHGRDGAPASEGPGNFPAAYEHGTTGILFDSGQAFATYFSGDPAWMYGIQWMPTGPWFSWFGEDADFGTELLARMFDERPGVLGEYVPGDNGGNLARAAKQWYGVGTDWGADVQLDRAAAVRSLQDGVRNAYRHHAAYVTARTAANPLYDAGRGALLISVGADGELVFPADVWNPDALPAALRPVAPPADAPDRDPKEWATSWPAFRYLSTDYTADPAALEALYAYDVRGFDPGDAADVAHAADVYARMGDALGNVVLGYVAQVDPDMYAVVSAELEERGDPVARGVSMAGLVHYTGLANRGLGQHTTDRRVGTPTSQVYRDGDAYTYVVFNPTDEQQRYPVYEGARQVGTIEVPPGQVVRHRLDAALDRVEVSAAGSVRTVPAGQEVALTATGYDQYGAVVDLPGLTWTVDAGGTVASTGARTATFRATQDADPVTVRASSGGVTGTYALRVGAAPALAGVSVEPAFARVVSGERQAFSATGVDQYGDPFPLGSVAWSAGDRGSVADGAFTAGAAGAGRVTATVGGVTGSAVVAVVADLPDVARGKAVTASSAIGAGARPELAVDGDASTRWESEWADGQWLQVDLGARHELEQVEVDWEGAAAATFSVQVADAPDGPWRTLRTVTKTDASPDAIEVDGAGRYVRLDAPTRLLPAYGVSVFELRVRGVRAGDAVAPTTVLVSPGSAHVRPGSALDLTAYAFDAAGHGGPTAAAWSVTGTSTISAGGRLTAQGSGAAVVTARVGGLSGTADVVVGGTPSGGGTGDPGTGVVELAQGRPAVASSVSGGQLPGLALDGNPGSRWESQFADDQWLRVDLGQRAALTRVEIDWETAAPARFSVQVGDSPTGPWTTLRTVAKTSAAPDVVAVAGTGRYLRIDAPERLTPWGVSIWELRAYGTPSA
ncbi:hypothetical protein CBR64_08340 [Cellulosimicrobium cellulans]|uniref:glucan endo-1,3-beta-D-glucosidase n=1 Tax=Cellulosimicrobium cellulans TaxID=1710 RepID=A0A1Y0HTK6_CELCE|nr:glycosyl hydrolase [Cellulosimicrobium cellulans]ARU51487.1 hypothetical protein CBR64_08340 [Cellulosimicrobium cellulans]